MSRLPAPRPLPETENPPIALGMLSLVLGTIGLLLFFLPILGLPISAFASFFGLLGVVAALAPGGVRLRWALLGSGVAFVALAVNIAILYAPGGYLPDPVVPRPWQPVPDRPYVPPPARPGQGRAAPTHSRSFSL
jgi:hypothetical protein